MAYWGFNPKFKLIVQVTRIMLLAKDRVGYVGYLDNALKHRARAPKQPLKDTLKAFFLCTRSLSESAS